MHTIVISMTVATIADERPDTPNVMTAQHVRDEQESVAQAVQLVLTPLLSAPASRGGNVRGFELLALDVGPTLDRYVLLLYTDMGDRRVPDALRRALPDAEVVELGEYVSLATSSPALA